MGAGPSTVEVLEVVAEIVGGDSAVGGVEMSEKLKDGDVGEAKGVVTELVEISGGDSRDDLLFETGGDGGVNVKFFEIGGKAAIGFGDLRAGGGIGMNRLSARMYGGDEGDVAGCDAVGGSSDGDGEMA